MKELLRKIYYSVLKILPIKLVVNIENLITYKRFFNKNKVEYFGEKIQWLKLYGNLEKYNDYVDKYKVREFIENKIGNKYLIPIIAVYDSVDEIDYEKLPNQFVLKLNHGSGYNIIVKDKSILDIEKTNKQLNKWLKEDYYKIKKEYQYKNVKRKIICEQFIEDKNEELLDYKYFCFNGKAEFIKVDFDRHTNHSVNFYDTDWNKLNLYEKKYKNYDKEFKKPQNYDEMLNIAVKLSEDFQFVRVDLYNVDGKIYFGELTFTPASGRHSFLPLKEDMKIAEGIKLK